MHKMAFQRYIQLLQDGAWLQLDSPGRKRQRWIMWKLGNGQITAEALLKDDFRYLVSTLNLRRVEHSGKMTRFVLRDATQGRTAIHNRKSVNGLGSSAIS